MMNSLRTSLVGILCLIMTGLAMAAPGDLVVFNDPALEAAVEAELGPDPNEADMLGLTYLFAGNKGVSDLTGLEYALNLQELYLLQNNISDLSPLTNLTSLGILNLSNNNISNLSALSDLINLTYLNLSFNNISIISALSELTDLETLDLAGNTISNISALSDLTNLKLLYLGQNSNLSDVSPLAGLTNLKKLSLDNNSINNISALSGLTNLDTLHLHENSLSNISALSGLTNLEQLFLQDNNISNISALSSLTNLTDLDLSDNNISSISALSGLSDVSSLDLENNNISDISALTGLTSFVELILSGNPLNEAAYTTYLPVLESLGDNIYYDPAPPAWPPGVDTRSAQNVRDTSALLVGTLVYDGSDACEVRFRYWIEGQKDQTELITSWQTVAGGESFGDTVYNLLPETAYLYMAEARNSVGTDTGEEKLFTTTAAKITTWFVDDNASNDPGPNNPLASDPDEDGSMEHPFDSIQEAIDAASNNDIIQVAPGRYYETINLMGKNIALSGFSSTNNGSSAMNTGLIQGLTEHSGHTDYPIIDADYTGTVVTFDQGENASCVLSGFVLTKGYGSLAGAVACVGSSPVI